MNDPLQVILGDARHIPLADESVHCVVTSPPYWGLRDYGTARWDGGDADCDHTTPRSRGDDIKAGDKQGTSAGSRPNTQSICHCGAVRIDAQVGLELSPEGYVETMVEIFREVKRVLRRDGTCWLNLGDSYARAGGWSNNNGLDGVSREEGKRARTNAPNGVSSQQLANGLKSKDLVGVPWRVAFALQVDGWYLRSDIIWNKPNPMPESVTDRPTKSHEYIFLLTKSERYFFDAEAVKESATHAGKVVTLGEKSLSRGQATGMGVPASGNGNVASVTVAEGRNIRSVWTIPTAPFSGAHFATFPPALIRPCILAGTSARGVCGECGAPWTRIVEKQVSGRRDHGSVDSFVDLNNGRAGEVATQTIGWQPSCKHKGDPVPATVLDPFAGSFTTCKVAIEAGRRAIGVELNPAYIEIGKRRCDTFIGLPF